MMDHPNRYFDESRYLRMGKHPLKIRTEIKGPASPIRMETTGNNVSEEIGTSDVAGEYFDGINPEEFEDLDL